MSQDKSEGWLRKESSRKQYSSVSVSFNVCLLGWLVSTTISLFLGDRERHHIRRVSCWFSFWKCSNTSFEIFRLAYCVTVLNNPRFKLRSERGYIYKVLIKTQAFWEKWRCDWVHCEWKTLDGSSAPSSLRLGDGAPEMWCFCASKPFPSLHDCVPRVNTARMKNTHSPGFHLSH